MCSWTVENGWQPGCDHCMQAQNLAGSEGVPTLVTRLFFINGLSILVTHEVTQTRFCPYVETSTWIFLSTDWIEGKVSCRNHRSRRRSHANRLANVGDLDMAVFLCEMWTIMPAGAKKGSKNTAKPTAGMSLHNSLQTGRFSDSQQYVSH